MNKITYEIQTLLRTAVADIRKNTPAINQINVRKLSPVDKEDNIIDIWYDLTCNGAWEYDMQDLVFIESDIVDTFEKAPAFGMVRHANTRILIEELVASTSVHLIVSLSLTEGSFIDEAFKVIQEQNKTVESV